MARRLNKVSAPRRRIRPAPIPPPEHSLPPSVRAAAMRAAATWRDVFLACIAEGWMPTAASRTAGVARSTPFQTKAKNPLFARQWAEAEIQGREAAGQELVRRAVYGTRRLVLYEGRPVFVAYDAAGNVVPDDDPARVRTGPLYETTYSDRLLLAHVAAHDGRYARSRHEHSGPDGAGIPVDGGGLAQVDYEKHAAALAAAIATGQPFRAGSGPGDPGHDLQKPVHPHRPGG